MLTKNKAPLYASYRWKKLSKRLRDTQPRFFMCWYCNVNVATEVDHIDSRDMDKFFDMDNLVGSCSLCRQRMNENTIQPLLNTDQEPMQVAIDKAMIVNEQYGAIGIDGFKHSVDIELLEEVWCS